MAVGVGTNTIKVLMNFLALQSELNIDKLVGRMQSCGIQQWLYIGEDSTWRVRAETVISAEFPRISIADRLHEMSWELRQPYIDWIGELSQLNDSLDWWASELAAKNPYFNLFIRICLLGVTRKLITLGFDRPTLIVCSSPALNREVLRFAQGSGVSMRELLTPAAYLRLNTVGRLRSRYLRGAYRRLHSLAERLLVRLPLDQFSERIQRSLDGRPSYRRQVLADLGVKSNGDFSGENAILLFTWVDGRNFSADGSYHDPHLGQLGELLRERGYRVAYVPRVLHTIPYAAAVNKLLQTDERFFFPESYVCSHDWRACLKRARMFAPIIPLDSAVGDVPVYRLAVEQVEQHRRALAESISYEPLIANLMAGGVDPRLIIYGGEGQSWEQALVWSVRRYMPHTKVVSYDNTTFSRLVLSMFLARNEYNLRPLPDRIVTNGPLYREVLLTEGMPPDAVKSGCALRHTYLSKESLYTRNTIGGVDAGPICILVATAVGFSDSVELAVKAARAFGGDPKYKVVIKCHPLVDAEQVANQLGELGQQENVRLVDQPTRELLPSTHLLLYTYTSVCFEALQHGVMPIFVRSENFLNLDKLEVAPNVRWVATTSEDLRSVVAEIEAMPIEKRRSWENRAKAVVREALAPVGPGSVDVFLL